MPAEFNSFAYVVSGEGKFGAESENAMRGQMVMFSQDGSEVLIENSTDVPLEALLIAGVPLNEPVVRYGPFVMNSREEIVEAFEDYRSGRMGQIEA